MARLSRAEISRLYRAVIDEYNASPLAAVRGWTAAPSDNKLREIEEICARLPHDDAVFLDVGTGQAIPPRFFRKLGYRVVAVDNPAAYGKGPLENAALAGIEAFACDIVSEKLPLADESVDCILCADVIEHLLHSPKFALQEFARVLKPGGVCIVTTPNAVRLSVRIRVVLGISNWPHLRQFFNAPYHRGHHHEYTAAELRMAFRACGFEIAKFRYEGTVTGVTIETLEELQPQPRRKAGRTHPLVRLAKIPVYILERLVPHFRQILFLVARKPTVD
jgi:SAM-dependent methyltransferase